MKIISETPEKIVLRLDENLPLANALRRSISEVEVLAVDEVEIFKNDSAIYDEVLAHRIGLLPLKTEKSMNSKTKIDLKLSVKGPCTVYAKDLQGPVTHIYPEMPISLLGDKAHKLEFTATATLGKGVDHAKYLPGLCYYRHLLEVKSSPKTDSLVEKEKKSLIKPEKKGSKWLCDLPEATVDKILSQEKDSVSDSKEILFVIESWGQIPAKDILKQTITALGKNLDDFEKQIK